jgi:3-oxocholest-4-en-26-oate---CoA ligase
VVSHHYGQVFSARGSTPPPSEDPVSNWNYGDIFESIAAAVPEWTACIHGERRTSWSDLDRRCDALAADLLAAGLGEQSKVAAYLYNGPEYLETYYAAFKAGLVPVNTNYRYGPEEIRYLFTNADAEAVVFHASFAPLIDQVRASLPLVKRWYVVDDTPGGSPEAVAQRPDWAVAYEDVVSRTDGPRGVQGPWGRSGEQLLFLYTGGTTGMPKGVMWRQDDLFNVLGRGGNAPAGIAPISDLAEIGPRFAAMIAAGATGGPRTLPGCPLMHGTGQFTAFICHAMGGAVVCLPNRSFDAEEMFDVIEREQVNIAVIVGDAFAKPMLAALDANPGRWDLSSLQLITSSGVMWSHETKVAMLEHLGTTALVDSYGSSEAVGLGQSVSTKGSAQTTAKFALGPTVHVFNEDNRRVQPGSDEAGFVAISGWVPVGYYKDPEKSAKTFREIDGVRYSVPGDFARVNPDGTLLLLGRGSVCINTGGEKVFPEEVEEVLKVHSAIADAVCVGLPDDRFGEIIVAVVQMSNGEHIDETDVIDHVRSKLARYKAPRHVVTVDTIGRSPAGKVDYTRLREVARESLGR